MGLSLGQPGGGHGEGGDGKRLPWNGGYRGGGEASSEGEKKGQQEVMDGGPWEEHSEQSLTITSPTPSSWKSRLPAQLSLGKASRIAAARSLTSTYAFRSSDPRSSPSRAT